MLVNARPALAMAVRYRRVPRGNTMRFRDDSGAAAQQVRQPKPNRRQRIQSQAGF